MEPNDQGKQEIVLATLSLRWTGKVNPPVSGPIRFIVQYVNFDDEDVWIYPQSSDAAKTIAAMIEAAWKTTTNNAGVERDVNSLDVLTVTPPNEGQTVSVKLEVTDGDDIVLSDIGHYFKPYDNSKTDDLKVEVFDPPERATRPSSAHAAT